MSKNNFFGLSLTERLNQAGITNQFSQAVKSSDASTMAKLLQQVDYSQESAKATIDTFLANPNAFQR
ncbi:MAG: hypothetical protein OEM38_10700 [Gammaproteobacteria bacterium]|nr:hypothetical protein [Gammaproteobacteria bacterium]